MSGFSCIDTVFGCVTIKYSTSTIRYLLDHGRRIQELCDYSMLEIPRRINSFDSRLFPVLVSMADDEAVATFHATLLGMEGLERSTFCPGKKCSVGLKISI
jgi:hypothetical protein